MKLKSLVSKLTNGSYISVVEQMKTCESLEDTQHGFGCPHIKNNDCDLMPCDKCKMANFKTESQVLYTGVAGNMPVKLSNRTIIKAYTGWMIGNDGKTGCLRIEVAI